MMAHRLALVLSLALAQQACSFSVKTYDPDLPISARPQCDQEARGKLIADLVGVGAWMAASFAARSLDAPVVAGAGYPLAVAHGVAALYGRAETRTCRRALQRHQQFVALPESHPAVQAEAKRATSSSPPIHASLAPAREQLVGKPPGGMEGRLRPPVFVLATDNARLCLPNPLADENGVGWGAYLKRHRELLEGQGVTRVECRVNDAVVWSAPLGMTPSKDEACQRFREAWRTESAPEKQRNIWQAMPAPCRDNLGATP